MLGTAQMAGDVLHLPALKGIAAATAASPAPKVFSQARGLETFSSAFELIVEDGGGQRRSIAITAEENARLRGPYNRRNVFGAVLAYGPVLAADPRTRPMLDAIARRTLCDSAPLIREAAIELRPGERVVAVRVVPREGAPPLDFPLEWAPGCGE